MSRLTRILINEMAKSGGKAKLVKVPEERRPTAQSLKKLDKEIEAQMNQHKKPPKFYY